MINMMKITILSILLSVGLWADSTALFGRVINVSENDTLNVRSQSNYKSKKVAELPPDAYVGIEKCESLDSAIWCRVYPLVQQWYENFGNDSHIGWVNARYLQFSNRGNVIVKGKKDCDYALWCDNGKCKVAHDFVTDMNHNVVSLKTQWVEREYLKGESNFGVTPDNEDGICNSGMYIEDYLASENIKKLEKDNSEESFKSVSLLLKVFKDRNFKGGMPKLIHPQNGLLLSAYTRFEEKYDRHFSVKNFSVSYGKRDKLFWGYPEGSYLEKDLYAFFENITPSLIDISNIDSVQTDAYSCCFPREKGKKVKAYQLFFGNDRHFLDHTYKDWYALVLVVEQYKGKWYLSGMFINRSKKLKFFT